MRTGPTRRPFNRSFSAASPQGGEEASAHAAAPAPTSHSPLPWTAATDSSQIMKTTSLLRKNIKKNIMGEVIIYNTRLIKVKPTTSQKKVALLYKTP